MDASVGAREVAQEVNAGSVTGHPRRAFDWTVVDLAGPDRLSGRKKGRIPVLASFSPTPTHLPRFAQTHHALYCLSRFFSFSLSLPLMRFTFALTVAALLPAVLALPTGDLAAKEDLAERQCRPCQ